jgi:hypothetical protein
VIHVSAFDSVALRVVLASQRVFVVIVLQAPAPEEEVNLHFIAFVNKGDTLYQLGLLMLLPSSPLTTHRRMPVWSAVAWPHHPGHVPCGLACVLM